MNRSLLTGEVTDVETGASRKDGTPWQRATLLVGEGQWQQKVPLFLWDPPKKECQLRPGEVVFIEGETRSKVTPRRDGDGEWINAFVSVFSVLTLATPKELEPEPTAEGYGSSYDADDQGGWDDDIPF